MPKDIKTIPIETLLKDLRASIEDIEVCKIALKHSVTRYSGGSIQERLDGKERFVNVINAEIERRVL